MTVRSLCACVVASSLLVSLTSVASAAAKPSDSLLPATTKGYVCVPDLGQLVDNFKRSQWGQLVSDPAMQPFVESLKSQLRQTGLRQLELLGLTWQDIEKVPGGEMAVAVIQPTTDSVALAMVIDVSGHRQQAEALLAKASDHLLRNGGQRLRRAANDPIVAFQLPNDSGRERAPVAAYFLQGDLLVAADNIPVLESMLSATSAGRGDSLASLKAYHEITAHCHAAAGDVSPNLRWFLEPFGYAETMRVDLPLRDKHKGPDLIKVLRNQGFTAIQGIGGFVNFSANKYELLHRTMVYAPALPGRDPKSVDKYNLAARMLRFPAGGDLAPQAWIPSDVATYITLNWDVQTAYAAAESLVDEVIGEKGVFRDVVESLRDDPDGPKVDVEKNLVAHLGHRLTIIADSVLPIGPKSERKVFAIEVTDEAKVADSIARLMGADKDVERRDFEGFVIWEQVDRVSEVPKLEIETPGADMQHSDSDSAAKKLGQDEHFLPTRTICVAQGHLFMSSHIELLQKVLLQGKQGDNLNRSADFRVIAQQTTSLESAPISIRAFSRTDLAFRTTYELIRTDQMPQSETMLAKFLNAVMGDGKDGMPRKQKIDGHTLPPFDVVRHYFGPAGTVVSSLDDGWLCTGFTIANQPVVADKQATELSSASLPRP